MKSWTTRDWVVVVGLVAAGFLASRLFPDVWEGVVIPLAAAAFIVMMARHVRRERKLARETQAQEKKPGATPG